MKKRYAASISAQINISNAVEVRNAPVVLSAENKNEATGIALQHAKQNVFPVKDGWYGHQASVVEIPEEK